ncbi:hypothetical protein LIER_30728 [Lithospermum erythrorhizon]|uniref:Uncharacterized protein n=1 Tax=Lithospermum erythrorhizon TaxID=34254 RepID=A0AAV3RPP5_LITER
MLVGGGIMEVDSGIKDSLGFVFVVMATRGNKDGLSESISSKSTSASSLSPAVNGESPCLISKRPYVGHTHDYTRTSEEPFLVMATLRYFVWVRPGQDVSLSKGGELSLERSMGGKE